MSHGLMDTQTSRRQQTGSPRLPPPPSTAQSLPRLQPPGAVVKGRVTSLNAGMIATEAGEEKKRCSRSYPTLKCAEFQAAGFLEVGSS